MDSYNSSSSSFGDDRNLYQEPIPIQGTEAFRSDHLIQALALAHSKAFETVPVALGHLRSQRNRIVPFLCDENLLNRLFSRTANLPTSTPSRTAIKKSASECS
jgi:hypothetical protein